MYFISLNQDSETAIIDEYGHTKNHKYWYDGAPEFQRSWIDAAVQQLPNLSSLEYHPRICISTPYLGGDRPREMTVFRSGRVELAESFAPGFNGDALWCQIDLSDAADLLWQFVDWPVQLEKLNWNRGACSICYVCGTELGAPPWGIDLNSPTYDICPCCKHQTGTPSACLKCSIKKEREQWLKNLGFDSSRIDFDVLPQLRNLPTDFHRGWYCSDE